MSEWLDRKKQKLHTWTSHEIQESILREVGHAVLRNILVSVKAAKYFSIIVDETTDVSCAEQMAISVRYCDEVFSTHEVFLGLYQCTRIDAASLKRYIEQALLSLDLNLSFCRGQAYDGASAMSGQFGGLQALFKQEYPCMVYMYCAGHELNLVVKEAISFLEEGVRAFDILDKVGKFLRNSPKKKAEFELFLKVNQEVPRGGSKSQNVRPLCPTRWTLDKKAVDSFLLHYEGILNFLLELSSSSDFPATQRALASSYFRSMENFTTHFVLRVFQVLLNLVTPVHIQAQRRGFTVEEFRGLLQHLLGALTFRASDEPGINSLVHEAQSRARRIGLAEPSVPRRKAYELGHSNEVASEVVVHSYLVSIYKAVFEHATQEILRRYSKRDMVAVINLENVLISAGGFSNRSQDEVKASLDYVKQVYSSDVDDQVHWELQNIRAKLHADKYEVTCVDDLRRFLVRNTVAVYWLKNLVNLLKIYLCLPCSTCECERSFSALRRVKSYLRGTMGQARLNSLMILHVHKSDLIRISPSVASKTGQSCLDHVIDSWIDANQTRRSVFASSSL